MSLADHSREPPDRLMPNYRFDRRIGRGSYGEVWLAWNALGSPCAIKCIRRDDFDGPRPFEREFGGIQRYEPISRSHPHLVPILHVGRDDSLGVFIYVMELADADRTGIDPQQAGYVPRTLRTDIRRHGRLPAAECVAIGSAIASALAFLHSQGLVHRDVKPSNVIFVRGVPKLADIGLIAGHDEAEFSFVGTEGYIPPEGPGSAQAILFALGRLLYEISSGKDRRDYPEPPTDLGTFPDRRMLLGLNAIIRTACESELERRYGSADDLRDDLLALAGDIRHGRPGGAGDAAPCCGWPPRVSARRR